MIAKQIKKYFLISISKILIITSERVNFLNERLLEVCAVPLLLRLDSYLLPIKKYKLSSQFSPEILNQGKNEAKSPNQSKAIFEYLWVGKV